MEGAHPTKDRPPSAQNGPDHLGFERRCGTKREPDDGWRRRRYHSEIESLRRQMAERQQQVRSWAVRRDIRPCPFAGGCRSRT